MTELQQLMQQLARANPDPKHFEDKLREELKFVKKKQALDLLIRVGLSVHRAENLRPTKDWQGRAPPLNQQ